MRLSVAELLKLKEESQHKVWRFEEPKHADVGKCYSKDGEKFTIKACKRLALADVRAKALKEAWPANVEEAWVVEIEIGDHSDRPRFLAHAGMGDDRDYAGQQRRTKTGKKTVMMDEPTVSDEELARFAKAADAYIAAKQQQRRLKQRARTRLHAAKKALDALAEGVL
jgi:hypothetical protein